MKLLSKREAARGNFLFPLEGPFVIPKQISYLGAMMLLNGQLFQPFVGIARDQGETELGNPPISKGVRS